MMQEYIFFIYLFVFWAVSWTVTRQLWKQLTKDLVAWEFNAVVKSKAFFGESKKLATLGFQTFWKEWMRIMLCDFCDRHQIPSIESFNQFFLTSMIDHGHESDRGISDARHRIKTRVAVRSPHSQTSIPLIVIYMFVQYFTTMTRHSCCVWSLLVVQSLSLISITERWLVWY